MTREEAIKIIRHYECNSEHYEACEMAIKALEQEPKIRYCKDCKHFGYDVVGKVSGIPLAQEICKRWSDGCTTKEDGYCFLFEPQESEG